MTDPNCLFQLNRVIMTNISLNDFTNNMFKYRSNFSPKPFNKTFIPHNEINAVCCVGNVQIQNVQIQIET